LADLTSRDDARRLGTPPLQGRGRGWGLSAGRLDRLGAHARDMRREPTEPEKRLWRALSGAQLGFKFRRQAVIGPFIADFLCSQKAFIVEVDGDTHDVDVDRRRDAALGSLGFAVMYVTNADVMRNLGGVCDAIRVALEQAADRWDRPHPNPSPEGEGLCEVEARKLLEISLEGSVG